MYGNVRGVARIFQRGVTLYQTLSSWRFRHGMLEVVCLKKGLKGGVTAPPLATPLNVLLQVSNVLLLVHMERFSMKIVRYCSILQSPQTDIGVSKCTTMKERNEPPLQHTFNYNRRRIRCTINIICDFAGVTPTVL